MTDPGSPHPFSGPGRERGNTRRRLHCSLSILRHTSPEKWSGAKGKLGERSSLPRRRQKCCHESIRLDAKKPRRVRQIGERRANPSTCPHRRHHYDTAASKEAAEREPPKRSARLYRPQLGLVLAAGGPAASLGRVHLGRRHPRWRAPAPLALSEGQTLENYDGLFNPRAL